MTVAGYPEHEKLQALGGKNNLIAEFLDWLDEHELTICQWSGGSRGSYNPTFKSKERLLGEFFEIDVDELSREKDRMVDAMRGGT
jgi:hypothetical protein